MKSSLVGVAGKSDKNDFVTKSAENQVIYPDNLTQKGRVCWLSVMIVTVDHSECIFLYRQKGCINDIHPSLNLQ